MKEYRWVVLGCGVIANELACAMQKHGRTLYGVVNRTHEKAVAFAQKYGIPNVYTSFDEVCADKNVDIIYITTPHNTHIHYMKQALKAHKHVLCEKSITLNSEELSQSCLLAKENRVVLAEAMTLYHMPLYKKLNSLIHSGALGNVNLITMNFGSFKDYDMNNRFFNRNLAGGALLDIGVYALSFVRYFLESCPTEVVSQIKTAPTGVDENVTMLLTNEQGQMATIALSLHSKQPKRGMISCEKGYIEILEYPRGMKATITDALTGQTETITEGDTKNALWYEVCDMESAVAGQKDDMYLSYTIDVMKLMTQVRRDWHLTYPEEESSLS